MRTLQRRDLLLVGAHAVAVAVSGCGRSRAATTAPARASSAASVLPAVYDQQGGLFVAARVGDREERLFVFDTGASRSTISSRYAEAEGIEVGGTTEVHGTAGAVEASTARARLTLAGVFDGEIEFVVYGFGSYDPRCIGILGHEVLHTRPFRIDYRRAEVVWGGPPPPGTEVPLRLDGGIPRIAGRLQDIALDFRLDTGATFPPGPDFYINLAPAQARALGLDQRAPVKVFSATGTGDQVLELPVHRVRDFALGSLRVAEAFAIVQPAVGYFADPEAVGFLGNSVLDKLDPWLDYRAGRMVVARAVSGSWRSRGRRGP